MGVHLLHPKSTYFFTCSFSTQTTWKYPYFQEETRVSPLTFCVTHLPEVSALVETQMRMLIWEGRQVCWHYPLIYMLPYF
jgi:hypothetical protein